MTRLRQLPRWARAAAALAVIGFAGCDSESVVPTATSTNHVLRVFGDGAGSGTVTTPEASPQLSCTITRGGLSGVCGAAYPGSSAVRLAATPNAGSTFAGWSGACTGPDGCVVDMSKEQTVTAAFVLLESLSEVQVAQRAMPGVRP